MFPPEDVTSKIQEELFNILGNNTNVSIYKLKDYKGQIPCVQLWNIAYPNTFINIILYSRLVLKILLVFLFVTQQFMAYFTIIAFLLF